MTYRKSFLSIAVAFLFLSQLAGAQFIPAPTPIADPSDTRFVGVKEDWNSPALTTSNLRPVEPLGGYINDDGSYVVELLQVQWRWGDPIDLYVMKPKGVKKPGVILYLYGYPASTDRFKSADFQETVTKDGFAAVGFVTALTGHRYHDRPMREWFVSDLQECLAESAHDVQMVLDYLQTRGDLDMNRVGMYAQGSGASIGILASAVDPRIKVLDTIDPWGDWPTWMKTSPFVPEDERAKYVTPEFLRKTEAWSRSNGCREFRQRSSGCRMRLSIKLLHWLPKKSCAPPCLPTRRSRFIRLRKNSMPWCGATKIFNGSSSNSIRYRTATRTRARYRLQFEEKDETATEAIVCPGWPARACSSNAGTICKVYAKLFI